MGSYQEDQTMISNNIGTLPPQALDIEQAVIGAAMLDLEGAAQTIVELPAEVFYDPKNRLMWEAIKDLASAGITPDILTVTQRLRKKGTLESAGGAYNVSQMTNRVTSSTYIKQHTLILKQTYISRAHRGLCQEMYLASSEETADPLQVLDRNRKALDDLHRLTIIQQDTNLTDLSHKSVSDAKKRAELAQAGSVAGIPTGLKLLDHLTNGWQKSDLIILAARPSMGKTSLAVSFALTAARAKKQVRIFSLEVRAQNLVDKMIMASLAINADDYRRGQITHDQWEDIEASRKEVAALPIAIDDMSSATFSHMRAVVRGDQKDNKSPELVIIDYLQLASPEGSNKNYNRENEVAAMSKAAKAIAKDFDCPVILLAQMNRDVEKRKGHRPTLADLRESGAIEQDADLVAFLWRPIVYGMDTGGDGQDMKGFAEMVIAKHRNGPLAEVGMKHSDDMTQFWGLESNQTMKENKIATHLVPF